MKNNSSVENAPTLQKLFFFGRDRLNEAGVTEAANDARELLFFVFGIDRSGYAMKLTEDISDEISKIEEYTVLLERRAKREPLQYIIGKAWFMGLEFDVNPNVLIPRYDSEILVEETLKAVENSENINELRIMDMCTGSGCLLISVMKEVQNLSGIGFDISEGAVKTARGNAEKLGINAKFAVSDLFENAEGKFDIIISNPPYIKTEVIKGLDPEVRIHEPENALDGGSDGLMFYRKIVNEAADYLNAGGHVLFEIGDDEGTDVKDLMENNGFSSVRIIKDLNGRDRVVRGELKL